MSVPGCFGDEGVCSVGLWEESLFLFLGRCHMSWSDVFEGHDTDVLWTGMCTVGFGNSTCLLLRVTGRFRSTSLRTLLRKLVGTHCPTPLLGRLAYKNEPDIKSKKIFRGN